MFKIKNQVTDKPTGSHLGKVGRLSIAEDDLLLRQVARA